MRLRLEGPGLYGRDLFSMNHPSPSPASDQQRGTRAALRCNCKYPLCPAPISAPDSACELPRCGGRGLHTRVHTHELAHGIPGSFKPELSVTNAVSLHQCRMKVCQGEEITTGKSLSGRFSFTPLSV